MATRFNIMVTAGIILALNSQLSFANGLSELLFNNNVADPNSLQDNSDSNSVNSRETNAQDAQSQGNIGAGVALATGITLISIGVPMTLSIEPITVAAGWDLIAKGGMELAQSASNSQGASYNGDQRALLNGSQPLSEIPQVGQALNNPELDKALSDAGVNADDFKSRLSNGEFQNGADIMQALGKDVNPDVIAQAQALSNEKFGNAFAAASAKVGELGENTITASKDTENNSQNGSTLSGIVQSSSTNSRNIASSVESVLAESILSKGAGQAKGNGSVKSAEEKEVKLDNFNQMLSKIFGNQEVGLVEKNSLRQDLAQMGIQLSVKGISIFALAQRKYRQFGKNRKLPRRIAQR
ncbi:MAG: hypothetical protein FJ112_01850 [Deltaproteobacteria bacterium]|nr:hypothetical protein [Deltaproteobacteria bacterium]